MTLLEETVVILDKMQKCITEILFVSYQDSDEKEYFIHWNEFAELAQFSYDTGFGTREINPSLKVVGKDFWLERHEYDGSEWWEFKTLPTKPVTMKIPNTLKADL